MSAPDTFTVSTSREEDALDQLYHWLRYEGLTGAFGGAIFWLPYELVSIVLECLQPSSLPTCSGNCSGLGGTSPSASSLCSC